MNLYVRNDASLMRLFSSPQTLEYIDDVRKYILRKMRDWNMAADWATTYAL